MNKNKMVINRIKTHIEGFDKLIEGGFIKSSINLIIGDCGTGKTIFSLQYLYNKSLIDNENCIYFTFEEKKEKLLNQAKQFGFDIGKLENKKKGFLKIVEIDFEDINRSTISEMLNIIKETNTKNIVIDSISTLSFLLNNSENSITSNNYIKRFVYYFVSKLRKADLTAILISQEDDEINKVSKYISDSIIQIKYDSLGEEIYRVLNVKKMRMTKHKADYYPMKITPSGILIIVN